MKYEEILEYINNCGSNYPGIFGGNFKGGYEIQQMPEELAQFIELLREQFPRGIDNYLEIGCCGAGTTRAICDLIPIKNVHLVNLPLVPYDVYPDLVESYERNVANLKNTGTLRNFWGDSHSAECAEWLKQQDVQFDLIFIDGDHTTVGVEQDIRLAYPYLKDGGIMAFHDTHCPQHEAVSPARALAVLNDYKDISLLKDINLRFGITIYKKERYLRNYSEVSIIVQGPLHERGVNNLDNYLKFGNVIFSCWASDLDKTDLIARIKDKNVQILFNKLPAKYPLDVKNVDLQCLSSYNAARLCNSQYIIKLRCDESFSDLTKFIDGMRDNPDKLVASNIFFRGIRHGYTMHPCDHIYGGTKEIVLGTLAKLYDLLYDTYQYKGKLGSLDFFQTTPEQKLMMAHCLFRHIPIDVSREIPIMKNNIHIVRCGELGDIIVNYNGEQKTFYSEKDMLAYDDRMISNIEDYS